jgi:hypothetical protein
MAYRAGISVDDEHTGEKYDYTARSKNGQIEALEIITLDGGKSPSRPELWNAVEMSETRKNAMLAREWIGALPKEVSRESQRRIAESFGKDLAGHFGVAVDVCIHRHDEGNPHCHVLFTTRRFEGGELKDKTRELNDIATSKNHVEAMRQTWEKLCNDELKAVNAQEISMKSYARRSIEKQPVAHPKQSKTSSRKAAIARRKAAETEAKPKLKPAVTKTTKPKLEGKSGKPTPAPSFLERFGEAATFGLYKSQATKTREKQAAAEAAKKQRFAEERGRGRNLVLLAQKRDFDGLAKSLDGYEAKGQRINFFATQGTGRNVLHILKEAPQTEQVKGLLERIEKRLGPDNVEKLMQRQDKFGNTPADLQRKVVELRALRAKAAKVGRQITLKAPRKAIKAPSAPAMRLPMDFASKPVSKATESGGVQRVFFPSACGMPAATSKGSGGEAATDAGTGESFGSRLAFETDGQYQGRLAHWRQEQENKREFERKLKRRGPK